MPEYLGQVGDGQVGVTPVGSRILGLSFGATMRQMSGGTTVLYTPASALPRLLFGNEVGAIETGSAAVGAAVFQVAFNGGIGLFFAGVTPHTTSQTFQVDFTASLLGFHSSFTAAKRSLIQFIHRMFRVRRDDRLFVVPPDVARRK